MLSSDIDNSSLKKIWFFILILVMCCFARDWTTLVYMVADNDLVQWADSDLVEMQMVGSNDDIAIIVQVDKPVIGARRLIIHNGTVEEIHNLGTIDMCDWHTLNEFLQWGITTYPAKRYCLILWDHGTGWTMMPNKTFGYDGSSGNRMSIANGDLRKALGTAYTHTNEKIDVIAFDACLMQQVEVAYELIDYAKILVGPQSVCPLPGYRYDLILDALRFEPGMSGKTLAESMVSSTVVHYTNVQAVSYSAVWLTNLIDVSLAMHSFAKSVMMGVPLNTYSDIRENVQTIPAGGSSPGPTNEFIDLGDWLIKIDAMLSSAETQALHDAYISSIISSQYWGYDFVNTTGLTIWYPYTYREFKQLISSYQMLVWSSSSWASLLNWIYDMDDIRPTPVQASIGDIGNDNDFRLSWQRSHDLAEVGYAVIESQDTSVILYEPCEDTAQWDMNGFSLSGNNAYAGSYSYFSGNIGSARHSMETKNEIHLDYYGILSLYLYYNTEDMVDTLSIEFGDYKDIHYGRSNDWQERRILLPPGTSKLGLHYVTNPSVNSGGCYIDEIRLYELTNARFIQYTMSDTSLLIFNKEKGEYLLFVRPMDIYTNYGNVSAPVSATVLDYAEPYCIPNPFQDDCMIILDYPDTLTPHVEIFSLAGRLIRHFNSSAIVNKIIFWDGTDDSGREVGSGLYFIFLKDHAFTSVGKIARQR